MDELITLDQRVVKIKFYLNQTAQNIIEIGKELTAAKNEVPHGQWLNWLQENFNLTERTAQKFMKVAERFSKAATSSVLNSSQMFEMLALPEGETEKFIAEKAAAGTPVETMSVKTLRASVKDWRAEYEAEKARADEEKAKVENLFADLRQVKEENRRLQSANIENSNRAFMAEAKIQNMFVDLEKVKNQNSILRAENSNLKQNPPTVEPADYRQLQKAKVELQNKITNLQKQLANKQVEIVTPADYEQTKKELAALQKRYNNISLSMEIAQKLDAIAILIQDIMTSQSENGVEEYAKLKPERFSDICANFKDFLEFYGKVEQ